MRALLFTAMLMVAAPAAATADDVLKAGMNAPVSVVGRFATGEWATKHGSACPVLLHREAPKIAIYARKPSDQAWQLAKAVDELVAGDSALVWSYLFISHEHAPTPSPEEWDAQFAELKHKAEELKLKHISLGQLVRLAEADSNVRAKRQLGIFADGDIVLVYIQPKDGRGVIRYVDNLHAKDLDASAIESTVAKLKQSLSSDSE